MTEAKHPLKWKWSNPTTILRIVESVTYTHAPTTVISGSKSSTLFKELVEHSWDIELKRESAALFLGILASNVYLKILDVIWESSDVSECFGQALTLDFLVPSRQPAF
ncbi:hypothetical protein V8G54_003149 [Vigna mungo]|uniref:Uncharacterized protein n=1 Tax=Vigna mungo TaxID=3915 RepID=A0AAQ3PCL6_VIGMU